MTDTAAQDTRTAQAPNWLRVVLVIVAVLEGLEGMFKIPLMFEGGKITSGQGFGWAVTSELALTFPFALIALFFLIKGDVRRAIVFVAGLGLLKWISLMPSLINHPASFPGTGVLALMQVAQVMVFPLLMLMAIALACKNERLTLAGLVAMLPSIMSWLSMLTFAVAVMIYGF